MARIISTSIPTHNILVDRAEIHHLLAACFGRYSIRILAMEKDCSVFNFTIMKDGGYAPKIISLEEYREIEAYINTTR